MALREFELFHGAMLAKLLRSERPVTLRMIETKPSEAWAMYRINDAVSLLLKHSREPHKLKKPRGARSWTFVFGGDQIRQVRGGKAWVALACGSRRVNGSPMEACLLSPDDLAELLTDSGSQQVSITVRYEPKKSLRAIHGSVKKVVARNRLDTWTIQGS